MYAFFFLRRFKKRSEITPPSPPHLVVPGDMGWSSVVVLLDYIEDCELSKCSKQSVFFFQAAVNGDMSVGEGLSENDSGLEMTNENSPLTAAEPPSPFCPKQNGGAASPAGTQTPFNIYIFILSLVLDVIPVKFKPVFTCE